MEHVEENDSEINKKKESEDKVQLCNEKKVKQDECENNSVLKCSKKREVFN